MGGFIQLLLGLAIALRSTIKWTLVWGSPVSNTSIVKCRLHPQVTEIYYLAFLTYQALISSIILTYFLVLFLFMCDSYF